MNQIALRFYLIKTNKQKKVYKEILKVSRKVYSINISRKY